MPRPRKSAVICLICDAASQGTHLGVNACRACALFFKRTKLQNKNYVCRQSKHNCPVIKDDPFMCRSCRYQKCIQVGMALPADSKQTISDQQSTSDGESEDLNMYFDPSPVPSVVFTETIMDKMNVAYRKCLDRRVENEGFLRSLTVYNNTKLPTATGKDVFLSSNSFCVDALPVKVMESINMVKFVFPQYAAMSPYHMQSMLKIFGGTYHLLEHLYRSEQHFPGDDRFLMTSMSTSLDLSQTQDYFGDVEQNKSEGRRALSHYMGKVVEIARPAVRNANITEEEFHAAICLIIWDVGDASWIPDYIKDQSEDVRRSVCKHLGSYYREILNCIDYASRLGRLFSLIQTLKEATNVYKEQYQLFKLLGIFKDEDLMIKVLM